MRPKHKLIVLVAVAVLAMSVLFYVNLRHVRDTGPRRAVTSGGVETARDSPFPADPDGVPGWSPSDAA
ncbi:hypothetical protein AMK17_30975 [Streptomyces sp. CB00072]|uniref:hypothetical protein n=1 Tax=Streptomyces sp. CB00072 TaxID=1703928 RepID=UPI00093C55FD|nr:hypothetical protein [Streptomyces sp. CB00072]OKI51670.1 hypothetical protein AMK17_30975 [Streptomyces sp. CB00072]